MRNKTTTDALELLMPPEEIVLFSRLSAQALYYMERDALKHKFIIIEERAGSMEANQRRTKG